ncbi:hypothetical protein ABHN11_13135 [Brevibacillus centrosporus]|uniref:hypothetical protein n=2 Tax=Brevibacillus centrosporus TaxID=54910 RepID=UPI003D224F7F
MYNYWFASIMNLQFKEKLVVEMFSFLGAFFESPFIKFLAVAIIIALCIGAPTYIPWFESSYFGQRLIEAGIWPDNMTLWPHEIGMKILTLGSIGVILSGYLGVAAFIIFIVTMALIFIGVPFVALYRRIQESKIDRERYEAELLKRQQEIPPGYRRKGNGKLVRIRHTR